MSDDTRKGLDEALAALSAAKTSGELVAAKARVARDVRRQRRREAKTWGPLAQAYGAAMTAWDAQKAAGVPKADRLATLGQALRTAWPTVGAPSFACETCEDIGWRFFTCTPETPCGRPWVMPGQAADDYTGRGRCAPGHSYVRPCWCEKGQRHERALAGRGPTPPSDDFTKAGKSKGLTRIGR